jgi:hypothetical protein
MPDRQSDELAGLAMKAIIRVDSFFDLGSWQLNPFLVSHHLNRIRIQFCLQNQNVSPVFLQV